MLGMPPRVPSSSEKYPSHDALLTSSAKWNHYFIEMKVPWNPPSHHTPSFYWTLSQTLIWRYWNKFPKKFEKGDNIHWKLDKYQGFNHLIKVCFSHLQKRVKSSDLGSVKSASRLKQKLEMEKLFWQSFHYFAHDSPAGSVWLCLETCQILLYKKSTMR